MQLFTSVPDHSDQVRRLQQSQMLGHCLPRHVEMFTKFAQRLPVALVQLIKQLSTAPISQSFEHLIHHKVIMQPFGCMSSSVSKILNANEEA
jgi:hypothetical protein